MTNRSHRESGTADAEPHLLHTTVAIVGAGPAGLMAAERISRCLPPGSCHLFDAQKYPARKFLRAGVGGLNITNNEPLPEFITHYGSAAPRVGDWLNEFSPKQVRAWMHGLHIASFVGSSGKVFPQGMKAAPLLRAWLQRLAQQGAVFHGGCRCLGWAAEQSPVPTNAAHTANAAAMTMPALKFSTADGILQVRARAVLLALGGGSWPRLGSDGAWVDWLRAAGVEVQPLLAANCGFDVNWSDYFRQRFAGTALKNIAVSTAPAPAQAMRGEILFTDYGIEGAPIYRAGPYLRAQCARHQQARVWIDLLPQRHPEDLLRALSAPRASLSWTHFLRRQTGLKDAAAALLRECFSLAETNKGANDFAQFVAQPERLTRLIKSCPITLLRPRPLAEAISSAGGVSLDALNNKLMLHRQPGVFVAGEMLDWEAPTGGYLLTACLASGYRAGNGIKQFCRAFCEENSANTA